MLPPFSQLKLLLFTVTLLVNLNVDVIWLVGSFFVSVDYNLCQRSICSDARRRYSYLHCTPCSTTMSSRACHLASPLHRCNPCFNFNPNSSSKIPKPKPDMNATAKPKSFLFSTFRHTWVSPQLLSIGKPVVGKSWTICTRTSFLLMYS